MTAKSNRSYNMFRLLVKSTVGVHLEAEYRFHPERMWRFDFAAPDLMLAIEIEGGVYTGGRHTRGTGFIKDMEKYNQATILGWKVLRFTPDQLMKNSTLHIIQQAVKNFAQNRVI